MKIKVGVVQALFEACKIRENLEKADECIRTLGNLGCNFVVLPELFNTGYSWNPDIFEAIRVAQEETNAMLSALAKEYNCVIIAGVGRKVSDRYYNSAGVFPPNEDPLFYDKTHLFRREKELFTPGKELKVFTWQNLKFGCIICYETGFPEIARTLANRDASIIFALFAFSKKRRHIYEVMTRSRALENGTFLVASAQVGKGFFEFNGYSRIVHPSGRILKDAGEAEGIIWCEIETDEVKKYRYQEIEDSHAYFSNFRKELYEL